MELDVVDRTLEVAPLEHESDRVAIDLAEQPLEIVTLPRDADLESLVAVAHELEEELRRLGRAQSLLYFGPTDRGRDGGELGVEIVGLDELRARARHLHRYSLLSAPR